MDRVSYTELDRIWCFSPCKNALDAAEDKKKAGLPEESARSAE